MSRIARLKEVPIRQNLPNFFVIRLSTIRYLYGFSGNTRIFPITSKKVCFFSDFHHREPTADQEHNAAVLIYQDDPMQELRHCSGQLKGKVAIDAAFLGVEPANYS